MQKIMDTENGREKMREKERKMERKLDDYFFNPLMGSIHSIFSRKDQLL